MGDRGAGDTSCAIAQNTPRELAPDRGGDLGFGFSSRAQAPEARGQAKLGSPRNVADCPA